MSDAHLRTQNLRLVPNTPDHLLSLISGDVHFQNTFGLTPAPGFREFFVSDEISPAWVESLKAASGPDIWRDGFALVLDATDEVIGCAGFKGNPQPSGMVEISYGIVPEYQGKGYATEAAQALVDYAIDVGHATLLLAHTRREGIASQRVLQKCGFQLAGEVIDPEDGTVLRWEMHVRGPVTQ